MSNTYAQLFFHVVWSTKNREPFLNHELREEVYRYIGGIVKHEYGVSLTIGGIADHVHMLINLSTKFSLSQVMRRIKANSSVFLRRNKNMANFEWQKGYGAFSVSTSMVPVVKQYICNQESHHKIYSFEDEFVRLLKKHNVVYDEKYIFG